MLNAKNHKAYFLLIWFNMFVPRVPTTGGKKAISSQQSCVTTRGTE